MTSSQLRTALARLGLTQVEAARLLRTDPRTMRRWLKVEPNPQAAILVELMLDGTLTKGDLDRLLAADCLDIIPDIRQGAQIIG